MNRVSFKREYIEYLESEEWAKLRSKVLTDANGYCNCGNHAVQVHHLTYAHVFNESPCELVAVCDSCHKKIHKIDLPHKKHRKRTAHLFPISQPHYWANLSSANRKFDKAMANRPLRPPGK